MTPTIKIYADNQAVTNAFAADFVDLLQTLSASQERVTVALSGGSTPQLLFSVLAEEYASAVDWRKIHFFWGDERCVPPTDPASNFGAADRLFLSRIEIPPENIHRVRGENDPTKERVRYSDEITAFADRHKDSTPRLDIILLGIGDDGHTASIFPSHMELLTSDNVCEIATHPESGQMRITVTGKVINASSHVFFLVTGSGKSDVLSQIIRQTGDFKSYPTSHVSPVSGPVFYLDKAAASKLEDNRSSD